MVAVESTKFFKDSFVKGGFTDESFRPWMKRAGPLGGKKILIGGGSGNTMNLMQSIKPLEESEKRVRSGTTLAYSGVHNNGGVITVTKKMKKFWWAKYYEFVSQLTKTKAGKTSNTVKNRTLSTKALYCRNMALMRVGAKIIIPQRQYLGESKTLLKQFEAWWKNEIEKE